MKPRVPEQAVEGEQRAEHHEDPQLHDLHDVLGARLERRPDVGPQDAEHDRRHERGDQAVPVRRQDRRAIRDERDSQRVHRLLVRGDVRPQRPAKRQQSRGEVADQDPGGEPDRDVLEHESPPHEVAPRGAERRGEREDAGQR
jgi:hypothetical protein